MTYTEWAATVERGVTITPEMAFAAGSVTRDAEIAELAALLERVHPGMSDYDLQCIDECLAKVRKP